MRSYVFKAYPMDKHLKATLVNVKSIINQYNSMANHHLVKWDGKHFVGLQRHQSGKWEVHVVVLKTGEIKNRAILNPEQVVGWVYGALNRIQYLKYHKQSKFVW